MKPTKTSQYLGIEHVGTGTVQTSLKSEGRFKSNIQTLVSAIALISATLLFPHAYADVASKDKATANVLQPSREQSIVTRQMAMLMDTQHYLNMRLDTQTSRRILDMYFDNLDADHAIFLASDIDEFRKKYADNLGTMMKKGDLSPAFDIQQRYTKRLKEYYAYSLAQLDVPQNLKRTDSVDTDREKDPYFNNVKEQKTFWQQQLVSALRARSPPGL